MMERQDINTLKILQELSRNNKLNQRALSKKLNISLGLTNSFVKRLVNKGFFKITTLPKSRIKYILTPEGTTEKDRLTCEYFKYSMQYYKMMRKRIRGVFCKLEEKSINRIYFYGVGELAEIAFITLYETNLVFAGIWDDEVKNPVFLGQQVRKLSKNTHISQDCIVAITKMGQWLNAYNKLVSNGIPKDQIVEFHV